MPRLLDFGDETIPDQVTQLLPIPVTTPVVSGYMQDVYNARLIALLSQLCADPEQFVKEASK